MHPPEWNEWGFSFWSRWQVVLRTCGWGLEVISSGGTAEISRMEVGTLHVRNFFVRNNGDIYATTKDQSGENQLSLIPKTGKPIRLDEGLKSASGIALTPDGLWLFVAQQKSHSGLSYRIRPNGMLDSKEPYYDFYVPAWADDSGSGAISMANDGFDTSTAGSYPHRTC